MTEVDLSHEIRAFEESIAHHQAPALATPVRTPTPLAQPIDAPPGFFDEFGQFLLREDLDAEGLLDADILRKMRDFHQHVRDGKEYYLYSADVQKAIGRKLSELKTLEREWFHTQRQLDELERGRTSLEQEIESRGQELKGLLRQAKAKSLIEKASPPDQPFVLRDGRRLRSLLDLRIALRTMPDDLFHAHVTSSRNDFATWVHSSLQEPQVADELARLHDRHSTEVYLSRLG